MLPAIYWSASEDVIQGEKTNRKNNQAKNAIENGLTSQLIKRVMKSPRGRRLTLRSEDKSTFIIMGIIMSQIKTAIGKLMWLPCPNSHPRNVSTNFGTTCPIKTPATMQRPTQRLK